MKFEGKIITAQILPSVYSLFGRRAFDADQHHDIIHGYLMNDIRSIELPDRAEVAFHAMANYIQSPLTRNELDGLIVRISNTESVYINREQIVSMIKNLDASIIAYLFFIKEHIDTVYPNHNRLVSVVRDAVDKKFNPIKRKRLSNE